MAVEPVHGKAVLMYFPLPKPEDAERMVAEHVPSRRFPAQCACGYPFATCWQRIGALKVLEARQDQPAT